MIHHGDLFDVLPTLAAESIDACVTDPPYGIGFMGKEWDNFRRSRNPNDAGRASVMGRMSRSAPASGSESDMYAFQAWCESWAVEVFRVLKPGGCIVSFGATRSFHRMTCGLEDAGFEIRDCLSWLYGQGFPKSLNVGEGRGTALKPSWEPCVLGRKPFKGGLKPNLAIHHTGALNIDACRIAGEKTPAPVGDFVGSSIGATGLRGHRDGASDHLGRWPANVILDEDAAALLDEQTGQMTSGTAVGGLHRMSENGERVAYGAFKGNPNAGDVGYGDVGGASRFYYVAKPSREERDYGTQSETRGNFHPTVKPVELMRWLVKLVTPMDGIVLDPFTGSGTTGMACRYEQRQFIGVEREAEYVQIAERRIGAVAPLFGEIA